MSNPPLFLGPFFFLFSSSSPFFFFLLFFLKGSHFHSSSRSPPPATHSRVDSVCLGTLLQNTRPIGRVFLSVFNKTFFFFFSRVFFYTHFFNIHPAETHTFFSRKKKTPSLSDKFRPLGQWLV